MLMSFENSVKKGYYRCFQFCMGLAAHFVDWSKPQRITGEGSLDKLPALIKDNGLKKILFVTGPHLVKTLGPRMSEMLAANGLSLAVFSDVEANPSVETVNAIYEKYLAEKCEGFVALGGGSPIDAAKAAAARVAAGGRTLDKMAGLLKVGRKLPLFIAVPTTSGTGSETTFAAVITDRANNHKYAIMDPHLIPRFAVMDPRLAAGMSPKTTSTTGMDALTHAVEAYLCWTNTTRESIRLAEEATCTIFRYLERAYRDGEDMEAREQMMTAAFKAGFAFTRSGVGNVHAIAHTLGGFYNTPHGLANAVILPIVLEDYGAAVYDKLARLAELTGVAADGTAEEKARAFIREVYDMNRRMGIPTGFSFIRDEDIPTMVKYALREANPVYPVPVVYTAEHCAEVIRRIRAMA